MNWRIIFTIGIAWIAALPARGDDPSPAVIALTTLNDEMMDCFAFYGISAEGLRRRNPKDEQINRTEGMLQTLLDSMAPVQKQLGVSAADSNAQILARTRRQLEEIGDTFDYAVLFEKFGRPCQTLVDDPAARLRYWVERTTQVASNAREMPPQESRPTTASASDAFADSRSIVLAPAGGASTAASAPKPPPLALPASADGSELDRRVVILPPAIAPQPAAAPQRAVEAARMPAAAPSPAPEPRPSPMMTASVATVVADAAPPAPAVPEQAAKPAPDSPPAPAAVPAEPPKAAQAASPPPADSRTTLDPAQATAMLRRADALAAIGDFSGARLFYERLASAGYKQAAMALARSYDPVWLRQKGAVGVLPDSARAAYWYERAATLAEVPQARP